MHIKQVLMSGFRSFRSQPEIESFSPKHNVIVGRNGSGKSNFFDAIQFVLLGPKFAGLRQEDRQLLLHEGAGTSVMAAYVEIVFDNSDHRFTTETDEVVIRRTVGLKKDEFFLNRRRVQKSEIISLLEGAGFSKSNPYYIVQQGKVSNLCVMKDKDRLNLLKEVAGTTVYEERRTESQKILQETKNKQEKVQDVLTFIQERMDELQKEKDELTEYEQYDKQRRAIEYTLYDQEFTKASDKLVVLENIRGDLRKKQQNLYDALRDIQESISSSEDNLNSHKLTLDRLIARKEANVSKIEELNSRKSTVEIELRESDANAVANKKEVEQLNAQLSAITTQIAACERELKQIEPEFIEKTTNFQAISDEFDAIRNRIEGLYGKQGRSNFKSKAERDEFLQQQITNLNKQITSKNEMLTRQQNDLQQEINKVDNEKNNILAAEAENKVKMSQYDERIKAIHAHTEQRNLLQEKKKSYWKALGDKQDRIIEATTTLDNAKIQLNKSIPRHIAEGIAALPSIVERLGITGYYGPVIDNFELKHVDCRTAVEVAAGNNLFHIIVDTNQTAAILMEELAKLKAGRLTFLPLNVLRNPHIDYPPTSEGVAPIVTAAIAFQPRVLEAMKQVFGTKMLAKDIQTANVISKQYGLDCITKDGDSANRKGGLEGGYHDERQSRMKAWVAIRTSKENLVQLRHEEQVLKGQVDNTDKEINEILNALQVLEADREHLRSNSKQLSNELVTRRKHLTATEHNLEERKKGLTILQGEIKTTTDKIAEYTAEKSTKMSFTEEERAELVRLEAQQRDLQPQKEAQQSALMAITLRKEKRTADLENNLIKKRDEIISALEKCKGSDGVEVDLEVLKDSLKLESKHLANLLESEQAELKEVNDLLKSSKAEVTKLEKSLDDLNIQERSLTTSVNEENFKLDKLLSNRSLLQETISIKQREIRELGVTPARERETFKGLSEPVLLAKLKEVNEELRKYSSVNKKALDQFVSFSQQKEDLEGKQREMDADTEAIEQLMTSLDLQKDDAIAKTFDTVARHFREVFRELVPSGEGKLVMTTAMDNNNATDGSETPDEDDEEDGRKKKKSAVSAYQGVQVRVSFSGTGQQYQMQQLSGGQKALVALAIIFAIQRSDPAPFYLFDEIDQALDANYRAGVARLIQRQVASDTAPAQFITTTFRPELVDVADKWFGIALSNKVSNIYSLTRDDAVKFVNELLVEGEAVGDVTSMAVLSRGPTQTEETNEVEYGSGEESTPKKGKFTSKKGASKQPAKGRGSRQSGRPSKSSYVEESDEEEEGEDMEGEFIDMNEEAQATFDELADVDEE